MKFRLRFFLFHILYWYLYFVAARILFLLFQHKMHDGFSIYDIFLTFLYGAKLDLSVTAYILFLPALIMIIGSLFSSDIVFKIIRIYSIIMLVVVGFLIITDIELYTYWGFRLDTTPLLYLDSKESITASISFGELLKTILILLSWWIISIKLYLKTCRYRLHDKHQRVVSTLAFILILPVLLIMARGGTSIAPLNTGVAYFHSNQFLNHSAVNPVWNAMYSLTEIKNVTNSYQFLEQEKSDRIFDSISHTSETTCELIRNKRCNIILIMLESFTGKVIEPLGGMEGITPNLNHLTHEGILFSNFYANGDRTDKALVAVLGAYPPLPKTQIIKYPSKSDKLDYIPKTLKRNGYSTAFLYGGSVEFANYKSILVSADFSKIISLENFDNSLPRSKWGVYDHISLKRFFEEIETATQPFFYAMLTLSSHEPFAIPGKPLLPGNSEEIKFLNSLNYTDKCIGEFIAKAKKSSWWDNTLIILVADHGSYMPGYSSTQQPVKYHIPMIWTGGAISVTDTVISTIASQTDIAKTLFAQLGIKTDAFHFSKNLLSNQTYPFAFFTYNNGFGMLSSHSKLVYDIDASQFVVTEGIYSESDKNAGKAYLQILNRDFIQK